MNLNQKGINLLKWQPAGDTYKDFTSLTNFMVTDEIIHLLVAAEVKLPLNLF